MEPGLAEVPRVVWFAIATWSALFAYLVWWGLKRRRRSGDAVPEHKPSADDMRRMHLWRSGDRWYGESIDTDGRQLALVEGCKSVTAAFHETLASTMALDDTTPIEVPPPKPGDPPTLASLTRTMDDDG